MKKSLFFLLMIFTSFSVLFVSCGDDNDGVAPTLLSSSLSTDNVTVSLTFSEVLYANVDMTGDLTESNFTVLITGGSSTLNAFTLTHSAGSELVTIDLELIGAANGEEVLTVTPMVESIYDADANVVAVTEVATISLKDLGIIGDWKSYDISAILVSLGYDDSIYAYFNADQTYSVVTFLAGIEYELLGTYSQTKSTFDNIWDIELNQSTLNGAPYPVTTEGIFEVYAAAPDSMWYEVAQTNPAVAGVTPPTAEAGFGSTSGGAYGTMNVQKYLRIEE